MTAQLYEFTIEHMSVGVNASHFGKPMFVSSYVRVGPMRFMAYLDGNGDAFMDQCVQDDNLRNQIATKLRAMSLEHITKMWKTRDEYDEKRINEKMSSSAKLKTKING